LLSGRDDKVKKILGELQSIYDGEYAKATGTVGVLRSKSVFSMIACVTPAAIRSHHRYMSMIGGRFLCFRLPALTDIERQHGFERSWQESQREQNLRSLRAMIRQHVSELLKAPINLEPESAEVQVALNELALLLARGRGILLTEKMHDLNETTGEERFFYELADPQIEEPYRALQQLRTLARASARIHGRTEVTWHDLELMRRVVFGSMPKSRAEALMCFQSDRNVLNRPQFSALLGKRESSTRKLIDEMEALQLLAMEEVQAERIYRPVSDLSRAITAPIEPLDHLDDGQQIQEVA
jgi:hypothetical protein